QQERLVLGTVFQELQRVAAVEFGDMYRLPVAFDPVAAFVAAHEVKVVHPRGADSVLADKTRPVAGLAKLAGVSFRKLFRSKRDAKAVDAVPRHVLAGE